MTNWREPPPERRCRAVNATGDQCRQAAIKGGVVCVTHGGRAPQVKRKAAERALLAEASKLAARSDIEVITDPIRAIAENASRMQHMAEKVWDYVSAIDISEWETMDATRASQLQARVGLLRGLGTDLDRALGNWYKLGLDEAMVRISEATSEAIIAAMERTLAAVELEPETRQHLRLVLAEELGKAS